MGCGLKKLKPVSEEHSPGKIYSTLKRPQVETRVGPAYTYRFLDFLIGKDGGTSTLRLSSVRELPSQLQDLYLQGFVLAALHPFVQPSGPAHSPAHGPEHQLYRAILVRTNGGDRGPSLGPQHRLTLEECLSADQEPTAELIQGYVKKHVQDAADQGVLFVGFIQEAQSAPCRRESRSPSLSLHSSPSSVLGSLSSSGPPEPPQTGPPTAGSEGAESAPCGSEESTPRHDNNHEAKDRPNPERRANGAELLALYDHPAAREPAVRYYTVKVPLSVQSSPEGAVQSLDGPWLDHLTQHFSSGASLVDGHFHLGPLSDLQSKAAESVFIFQEPSESEAGAQAFDAIVVEQWTVIDGLQVKADYVPLLQSLASFGWRLTCVLPTPVTRTNSDGSVSTKQIVFLQRPVLSRKKKDSKKLIFKSRSKPNKNCIKESAKSRKSMRPDQLPDEPRAAAECNTDAPENPPEDALENGLENPPEDALENGLENPPEDAPENGPENAPEDTLENGLETGPEDAPENTPERVSGDEAVHTKENGVETDTEDQSAAGSEAPTDGLAAANQSTAASQE